MSADAVINGTALRLTVATPLCVVVDAVAVVSLRGEDESGCFGIRAGHVDYVTLLRALRGQVAHAGRNDAFLRGGRRRPCRVERPHDFGRVSRSDPRGCARQPRSGGAPGARGATGGRAARPRGSASLHAQAVRQMLRFLRPPGPDDAPGAMAAQEPPP